jgi:5-methylcytosine-specific restriction endonuclease McrA
MAFNRPCLTCGKPTKSTRCSTCARPSNLNRAAWRLRSKLERAAHPLCADHLQRGEAVAATEVHHLHRRADGGELLSDDLLALCTPCHSVRTSRGE